VFALAALFAARAARRLPMPLPPGWYAQEPVLRSLFVLHDVTNLYGLAGLLCALRGICTGWRGWFALLALLTGHMLGCSPWIVTAYDLPLRLCAGAASWGRPAAGLAAQFGPAARRQQNGQAVILLWEHTLPIG